MTKFTDLPLVAPIQMSLKEAGYENPTPIQAQAIPLILDGHDLLGVAQTGTGKTAAFCLPILQNLAKNHIRREPKCARALILTPTRELAIQIHQNLVAYSTHLKLKHAVMYGGVGQGNQVRDMAGGVDVLVATPGRLMDLFGQKHLRLDKVEVFVLDEADRMLDMGFIHDIKRILPLLPKKRHNLFFSATMPREVSELATRILHEPKRVEVTPQATTAEKIEQSVMFVEKSKKLDLLLHLLESNDLFKVLVFMQMKHGANRIVDKLTKAGIPAAGIHGNKSQGARQRALEDFRNHKIRVLVATDIAARGLDIDGITHVINFELPHQPDSYVHRIGRTARAGAEGKSIAFCTAEEKSYLYAIEKTTRQKITVIEDHPYHFDGAAKASVMSVGKAKAMIEKTQDSYGPRKPGFHARRKRFGGFSKNKGGGGGQGGGQGGKPGGQGGGAHKGGPKKSHAGGPRKQGPKK
ncbi:DEAD/DEAH box helicase [Bdellovibrio sp. HCB337]|uniref:DEAD/DEAH box helicase n=1 Tax=Bdellovibrio sp. HCB337 TaxID=3394358 RepID=UPI0039A59DED